MRVALDAICISSVQVMLMPSAQLTHFLIMNGLRREDGGCTVKHHQEEICCLFVLEFCQAGDDVTRQSEIKVCAASLEELSLDCRVPKLDQELVSQKNQDLWVE